MHQMATLLFLSMYPREFGDRSLASLLAEKASLKPADSGVLKKQIAKLTAGEFFRDHSDPAEMAAKVNRELFPKNVTGDFFPYTDCSPDNPFCRSSGQPFVSKRPPDEIIEYLDHLNIEVL